MGPEIYLSTDRLAEIADRIEHFFEAIDTVGGVVNAPTEERAKAISALRTMKGQASADVGLLVSALRWHLDGK